jgi:hypothetical protein
MSHTRRAAAKALGSVALALSLGACEHEHFVSGLARAGCGGGANDTAAAVNVAVASGGSIGFSGDDIVQKPSGDLDHGHRQGAVEIVFLLQAPWRFANDGTTGDTSQALSLTDDKEKQHPTASTDFNSSALNASAYNLLSLCSLNKDVKHHKVYYKLTLVDPHGNKISTPDPILINKL